MDQNRGEVIVELVVTIDAEEDQWGWNTSGRVSVKNIRHLSPLQSLFESYGVVPTYLLTYPVAADAACAALFRAFRASGRCEIGMHCHPWTTPPHDEPVSRYNSMLCNLAPSLQSGKVRLLYDLICDQVESKPVAFRSGRWGFDGETARILAGLGCRIDTSVTPYTSWTTSCGPDFSGYAARPFTFSSGDLTPRSPDGDMVEIPVTIGYIGGPFERCHEVSTKLKRTPFRQFRVAGLLGKLGIMRRVWLSPEREAAAHMIRLVEQAAREDCTLLNLFFHSSSLLPGCTPYVRMASDKDNLLKCLCTVLEYCLHHAVKPVPLTEAAQQFHGLKCSDDARLQETSS